MAKREGKKRGEKKRREKGVGYFYNPKLLKGTKIIDCTPQAGKCPLAKDHDCGIDCYFQNGWYIPGYQQSIPPKKLAKNRIVRFNSGNDSNNQRDLVMRVSEQFEDSFFNTSIPEFDFSGPVVFTCNSEKTNDRAYTLEKIPKNLMFVRFRINTWNLELAGEIIKHYEKFNVPIVLTFMRYRNKDRIPEEFIDDYECKKNVTNPYFMIRKASRKEIIIEFRRNHKNVFQCGTYESSYCKDCGNCERFYYITLKKKGK